MPPTFPRELEEPFRALWDDVSGVFSRWVMLLQLFGTANRIKLLNQAAPSFFHAVQQSLGDSVIIAIARLTDPAQTGKKENLTLQRLQGLVSAREHPQLAKELQRRLHNLSKHCEGIRTLRNRRLAHTDLPARLTPNKTPIPGVTRQVLQEALDQIADFMNCIDRYFRDSSTLFEEVIHDGDGDRVALLIEVGCSSPQNSDQWLS